MSKTRLQRRLSLCLMCLALLALNVAKLFAVDHAQIVARICEAASKGDVNAIKQLYDPKISGLLEFGDDVGWSALHRAAEHDHADTITFLLGLGAKVDGTAMREISPLIVAARSNAKRAVRVLLEHGADINFQFCHRERKPFFCGITPLEAAAREGHLELTKELVSLGAKICPSDSHGNALRWACANPAKRDYWEKLKSPGNRDVIEFLVEKGADVNQADQFGKTPLIMGVLCGAVETVRYLLKERKDVQVDLRPQPWGATALLFTSRRIHYLAPIPKTEQESRRIELIKLLLDAGADPELRSFEGVSPAGTADSDEIRTLFRRAIAQRKETETRKSNGSPSQSPEANTGPNGNPGAASTNDAEEAATITLKPTWVFELPTENENPHHVAGLDVDNKGNAYIRSVGWISDEDNPEAICTIRALDASGHQVWEDRFAVGRGAATTDGGVCWDGDGRVYVVGSTTKPQNDKVIEGQVDSFVAAYSSLGMRGFLKVFGGQGNELIRAVAPRGSGGTIVVGTLEKAPGKTVAYWTVLGREGEVLKTSEWTRSQSSVGLGIRRVGGQYVALCQGGTEIVRHDALLWLDESGDVVREQHLTPILDVAQMTHNAVAFTARADRGWVFLCRNCDKPFSSVIGVSAELKSDWSFSSPGHVPIDVGELSNGSVVMTAPFQSSVHRSHVARCVSPKADGRVVWDAILPGNKERVATQKLVVRDSAIYVMGNWFDQQIPATRSFVAKFNVPKSNAR